MRLTMVGQLDECLLVTYSAPVDNVRHLLPGGLEPVTGKGRAFWNIVLSHVDSMRPLGLPRLLGISYYHVAYRLQVHTQTLDGRPIQGLYFLRSDVNSLPVSLAGNVVTDLRLHSARIKKVKRGKTICFRVAQDNSCPGTAEIVVEESLEARLAQGSVFEALEQRESLLKYQPFGLSVDEKRHHVRVLEVRRNEADWRETPLIVHEATWPYLDQLGQDDLRLERATRAAPLAYRWHLGERYPLRKEN